MEHVPGTLRLDPTRNARSCKSRMVGFGLDNFSDGIQEYVKILTSQTGKNMYVKILTSQTGKNIYVKILTSQTGSKASCIHVCVIRRCFVVIGE
jgi:hypothetical protein